MATQAVIMVGSTGPTGSSHRKRTRTALYGLITLRKHYNGLLRFVTDSTQASTLSAIAAQLDVDVVVMPHRYDFTYLGVLNLLQHCGDADEWVYVDPFTIFYKDITPAFASINPQKPIALAPAQKDMVAYNLMRKGKSNKINRVQLEGRSNKRFADGAARMFAFRPANVVDLFAEWKQTYLLSRAIDKLYHMDESLNAADKDDLITLLPSQLSRKVVHLGAKVRSKLSLDEFEIAPPLPADTVSVWSWDATLHAYWETIATEADRDQLQSVLNS